METAKLAEGMVAFKTGNEEQGHAFCLSKDAKMDGCIAAPLRRATGIGMKQMAHMLSVSRCHA